MHPSSLTLLPFNPIFTAHLPTPYKDLLSSCLCFHEADIHKLPTNIIVFPVLFFQSKPHNIVTCATPSYPHHQLCLCVHQLQQPHYPIISPIVKTGTISCSHRTKDHTRVLQFFCFIATYYKIFNGNYHSFKLKGLQLRLWTEWLTLQVSLSALHARIK